MIGMWSTGNDEVFVYTESYEVSKVVKSIDGRGTI
jgi:hypothetical protein